MQKDECESSDDDSNTYSEILGKRSENDSTSDQLRKRIAQDNDTSEDGDLDSGDRRKRR